MPPDAAPERPARTSGARWPSPTSAAPVVAGFLLVLAGFAALAFGSVRVAALDSLRDQLPYVIAAGLGGVCLVLIGGFVVALQSLRRESALRMLLLARLEELVAELRRTGRDQGAASVQLLCALLLVAGSGALAVAWSRATAAPSEASQMAALVAGGLVGLALTLLGLVVAHVDMARSLAARERRAMQRIVDEAGRLLGEARDG